MTPPSARAVELPAEMVIRLRGDDVLREMILTFAAEAVREAMREHVCQLPDSIKQALNSGDGSYKP
jgi:hypothetical protein